MRSSALSKMNGFISKISIGETFSSSELPPTIRIRKSLPALLAPDQENKGKIQKSEILERNLIDIVSHLSQFTKYCSIISSCPNFSEFPPITKMYQSITIAELPLRAVGIGVIENHLFINTLYFSHSAKSPVVFLPPNTNRELSQSQCTVGKNALVQRIPIFLMNQLYSWKYRTWLVYYSLSSCCPPSKYTPLSPSLRNTWI